MKLSVYFSVLAFLVLGTVAEAQVQLKPNVFPTMASCQASLEAGALRFYEPKYFGLRTSNPTNGRDRVVVALESDTCLEMLVVGGRRFVAQREGTLFRAQRLADGSLSLYAREDCGNPVYGVVYPAPVPDEPVPYAPAALPPEPPYRAGPERPTPMAVPAIREQKKGGFCSSKRCRWTVGIIGAAAAGYAAWYYWPCPPGTVRK